NANVLGMAAFFTYGFPVSEQNFEKANCRLITLSDYAHLLEQVNSNGYMDEDTMLTLKKWREDPSKWSN
ncbi:MAG: orotate phosphoribosyltransferase, partial [Owenweeksia sp.]